MGLDPSLKDNEAIRNPNSKVLLQDSRVEPSTKSNEAIRYASICSHYKVVKLLLKDARVDLCAQNNYALKYASMNNEAQKIIKL